MEKKPRFHITFNIKDLPLAQKRLNFLIWKCYGLKVGSIRYQTNKNRCVLNIYSIQGLNCVVSLINGKLRTPKAKRTK
jgi:hypothetical protein